MLCTRRPESLGHPGGRRSPRHRWNDPPWDGLCCPLPFLFLLTNIVGGNCFYANGVGGGPDGSVGQASPPCTG